MTSLNTAFLKSVKPQAGKRLEFADTVVRGLSFRVSEQGIKSWSFRYRREDGSYARDTLGTFPALGLHDARDRAIQAAAAVADKRDPAKEKQKVRREQRLLRITKPQTLADLWARYLDVKARDKRPSTLTHQTWLWTKQIAPVLGKHDLADIDRATIRAALRQIGSNAPSTANRAQSLLAAMLNWALDEELAKTNPVAGMRRLYKEQSRTRVLSEDEIHTLWAALEAAPTKKGVDVSARMCAALKFALLTGARAGDIVSIHASEVDTASRQWVIPAARFKGNIDHVVPLSEAAMVVLSEAFGAPPQEWTGLAFPHARDFSKGMERHSLTRAMKRIVEDAEIAAATPHDLRRTLATYLASERIGCSQDVVTKVLGQRLAGAAVTQVYNRHSYDKEKRAALEAWAALLDEIVAKRARPSNVGALRVIGASKTLSRV